MTITVKGPDGNSFQFPDGTPPDVMQNAMRQRYGGPENPQNQQLQNPPQSQAGFAVQGQEPPLTPEDLQRLGLPEGTTREQARGVLQQRQDGFQQQSDAAQGRLDMINPILGGANAVNRFANAATLGVPDRLASTALEAKDFLTGEDVNRHAELKGQKEQVRQQFPKSSIAADIGGTIAGLGKVAKAGKLPSQTIKSKGMLGSTAGLAADGAAIAGLESAIDGRNFVVDGVQGGMAGALLNAATRGAGKILSPLLKGKKPDAPTTNDLFDKAKGLSKKADDIAVDYTPEQAGALSQGIKDIMSNPENAVTKLTHPTSLKIARELQKASEGGINSGTLNSFRRAANKGAKGRDGDVAKKLLGEIEDFVNTNSKEVGALRKESNAAFRQAFTARDMEKALAKAERMTKKAGSGGNLNNNIRTQMESLRSGKKSQFMKKDEIAALDDVITGSKMNNALRNVGKLSPTTGGLTTILSLGAAGATGGSSLGFNAVGAMAKALADKGTKRKAKKVIEGVQRGSQKKVAHADTKASAAIGDKKKQKELARLLTVLAASGSIGQ